MEHRSVWLLMGILLALGRHAAAPNKTDIPHHVTLSPFWGWRSAAECLLTYQIRSEGVCTGKKVLTLSGAIVVEESEAKEYCNPGGCGDRTKDVLDCIHSVKRDFHFTNKAKLNVVSDAINNGCTNFSEISTANYTSSNAIKLCSLSLSLSLNRSRLLLLSMAMVPFIII
ncbi:hypothetical protein CCACVL1_11614 [Corchorus capsularis]|uniref:DUF7731 domain-containing protein n=1 Tax=Corchorus capsularis TaxID=210143 RepID=A0A1R3IK81_COCAP|nr:hypothetical protein CCACVL1_11614 [Corchorus capsularis]